MGNKIKCSVCGAIEYQIDRLADGDYIIRCAKSNTRDHQKRITLKPDSLQDLR